MVWTIWYGRTVFNKKKKSNSKVTIKNENKRWQFETDGLFWQVHSIKLKSTQRCIILINVCVYCARVYIRRWQGYIKSLVKEEEGGKPGWNWGEVTGRKRRCGSNLLRSDSSAPSPSCAWAPAAEAAVGWTFFSLFFGFGRTHTHHCQSSVWWWAPPFQWSSSSVRKSKRRREEMIWIIQSSGGGAWCSSPGKKIRPTPRAT